MNTKTSSNAKRPSGFDGLGKPDCPHCQGMGYVIPNVPPLHPSFGKAVPCACRAAEREAERMNKLQKMSQIGAFEGCTFDTFVPEGHSLPPAKRLNLKLAFDKALAYAKEPTGWIVFKGGYGCGKTHLAAAIANYRLALGHPVLFINTPDLLDHLRASYSPSATTTYNQQFERVRNIPLLILDDMGTENATEWAQEKLYQIFNHRHYNRLPTVITTNQELIESAFEGRVLSRMLDYQIVQTVNIEAPDFRRSQGLHADLGESELSTLHLHLEKRFKNFNLRQEELPRGQADNLRRAYETSQEFAQEPIDWLVLNSVGYGNGKTHLAAAIANEVRDKGRPVLFVVVPDLLDHLRAAFNPASGIRYDKRFDEIKTAPLLILDDLGTESATAWAREKLYQLFNYRYNARLPTVITTATPIDELDPRLATRMLDGSRCTFFMLEVPSYLGGIKPKQKSKRASRRR